MKIERLVSIGKGIMKNNLKKNLKNLSFSNDVFFKTVQV